MEVIVVYGPTGTGKSRWAFETYPDAFWAHDGKWFDGYDAQETVIFDEFGGHVMPYSNLLKIADRYPLSVEKKAGTVNFVARRVVFLSNYHPSTWYDVQKIRYTWDVSPLRRRITALIYAATYDDWQADEGAPNIVEPVN